MKLAMLTGFIILYVNNVLFVHFFATTASYICRETIDHNRKTFYDF